MRKWILISIVVFILAISTSSLILYNLDRSSVCLDCHGQYHGNNNFSLSHLDKNITCIDCHSGNGTRGYVTARKELINAILLEKTTPLIRRIMNNNSYNIKFIHLKSNCTTCHVQVRSQYLDHSNFTNCSTCHYGNISSENTAIGLLARMGTGAHRNKTCENCHSTNFQIPKCTGCHDPHKQKNWGNKICLGCHNSPHIPVRNGVFDTGIAKETCRVCHAAPYDLLTFYNSRHNTLGSCVYCHPAHKEKIKCFDCHRANHLSHPFAQDNCGACHGKAQCKDCHKQPHDPLLGLPRITSNDMFNNYADMKAHK